ncbi:type IV pilus assembly protein PilM [Candidatus Parcubacteria bacterium]|nr:type IV pilus assembly protein PilM [Candidatus Parcubacteria bacterium]
MFELLNLKPDAFGIDISDLSIKIIKLKKTSQDFELVSYGETIMKPGVIEKGEIKNEKELSRVIKNALGNVKGKKLKTYFAGLSLPEEKSFLKVIKMPKMGLEDLQEAVYFEAENHIPLAIEDVYFDFEIISPRAAVQKNYLEVLLTALPKKTVDSYIYCLKKAGIRPLQIEVESLSLARALIKNKQNSKSVLLIDLDANKTSFMFFSNNAIRFTCFSSVCSQTFTQAIVRFLKVEPEKAEELKQQYGFQGYKKYNSPKNNKKKKTKENALREQQVFEALIPSVTDLIEQVKKYMDFYNTYDTIDKILLSGDGACLKEIDSFFSSELDMPVELGDPWVNISEKFLLSKCKSYKYSIAIGLALGVC